MTLGPPEALQRTRFRWPHLRDYKNWEEKIVTNPIILSNIKKFNTMDQKELRIIKIQLEANYEDLKQIGLIGLIIGYLFTITATVFKEIFNDHPNWANMVYLLVAFLILGIIYYYHRKYKRVVIDLKTVELVIKQKEELENKK